MVALEARALKKLDSITPRQINLVISKPSKAAAISDNPVALILDIKFS